MISTVLIVVLVGLAVWLYLGGPMPDILPQRQRAQAIIAAWMVLRTRVTDIEVRTKLDELLPLLLREGPRE